MADLAGRRLDSADADIVLPGCAGCGLVVAPYHGVSPLTGVRVVEISSFVAVPLAGMTLAQLGAEVIRIDPTAAPRTITGGP